MTHDLTPSQTVGPYFGIAMTPDHLARLVPEETPGSIILSGKVRDGGGKPVPEGMIEIWQADSAGSYRLAAIGEGRDFTGFGRCHTDDQGEYRFVTLKPGPVPAPGGGVQAPHVNMAIFGGGLLKPLRTRVYFSDEPEANASDPILLSVSEARRPLLVARVEGDTATLDIRLQGDDETPFFDV
jgi:protocatechuate 3,4-dioxygenase, alpha subunit